MQPISKNNKKTILELNANVHCVFFDMDGVLCDSENVNAMSHEKTIQTLIKQYKLDCTLPTTEIIRENVTGVRLTDAINNLMLVLPSLQDYQQIYMELQDKWFNELKAGKIDQYLIEPSVRCLRHIIKNNVPSCIVSGSERKVIQEIIQLMKVEPTLPIIGAEDCVYGKPNPEPYLKAADLLKVAPGKHCIVIEDSLAGIESAKKAGMFVIALDDSKTDLQSACPDLIINNLDEICINIK